MTDFFSGVGVQLPRIGDTPFPTMPSGARVAAGTQDNWDAHTPVVYVGDGTQTQADQNNARAWYDPRGDFTAGKALGEQAGNAIVAATGIGGLINRALLGAAGIAVLAIGVYFLAKD
jgi:hypothetical protein